MPRNKAQRSNTATVSLRLSDPTRESAPGTRSLEALGQIKLIGATQNDHVRGLTFDQIVRHLGEALYRPSLHTSEAFTAWVNGQNGPGAKGRQQTTHLYPIRVRAVQHRPGRKQAALGWGKQSRVTVDGVPGRATVASHAGKNHCHRGKSSARNRRG